MKVDKAHRINVDVCNSGISIYIIGYCRESYMLQNIVYYLPVSDLSFDELTRRE